MLALSVSGLSVPTGFGGKEQALAAGETQTLASPVCRLPTGESFSLHGADIKANNLGGMGPWKASEPDIVLGPVGVTSKGQQFDIKITNTSSYTPAYAPNNGIFDTSTDVNIEDEPGDARFGHINLLGPSSADEPPNTVGLKFCAVDSKTGAPVTLSQFYFSIFDFDVGYDGHAKECVTAEGFASYGLTNSTSIDTSIPDEPSAVKFCATSIGAEGNNPKDLEKLSTDQKDRSVALVYTGVSCWELEFSLTYTGGPYKGRNLLWAGDSALVPMCETGKITIHGDPIFKHNGAAHRIVLASGEVHSLLKWKHKGHAMELAGRALGRGTQNQWFKQIVIKQDGKEVLDVEATDTEKSGGMIHVRMDGEEVLAGKPLDVKHAFASKTTDVKASVVPHASKKQRVVVEGAGLSLEVVPQGALKFAKQSSLRDKYRHLNIKLLSGIPTSAEGMFAELAGVKKMSAATQSKIEKKFITAEARK